MGRGGARIGAGRPRKSEIQPRRRSRAPWGEAIAGFEFLLDEPAPAVAYEFLTSAVQDSDLPFESRLKAAAILLPYEKRRARPLQPLGKKEVADERAAAASVGIFATPAPPPLRTEEATDANPDIYAPGKPPSFYRS